MPKQLIINNTPFNYPTAQDEPGWGGEATGWAAEVTRVINNVVGPDDILQTSFNIANNQTTASNVTGLIFNAGSVRSAVVSYSVYRISDSNPSGNAEVGEMHILYDNNEGWKIGVGGIVGGSGVLFSITPAGQVQYTSTDLSPADPNTDVLNYVGVMRFTARALQQ